ncbi:amidoligase family protein [Natronogracilivirga saccharolytica]|uniref:Amidoligase family protein n=1 Tax=Natronogracilivirga saccharolytica TaxID=2812953 RepID=A0A8J7UUR0_9BACT|nr:amidoligase family protein [Natronogracilivirga saccharolytica]MBP3191731.1 amidoligase family protein [Natronogracilivirga saccharolytica]
MAKNISGMFRKNRFPENTDIPPRGENPEGKPRKMGLEIEFSGLTIDRIVSLVRLCYGGEVESESDYKKYVRNSRLGDFTIELDWILLQKLAKTDYFKKIGKEIGIHVDSRWQKTVEKVLASTAEPFVPYEVSFPPVTFDRIADLEDLRKAIYRMRGKGTSASPFNAFGLHLNPEVPSREVDIILRYFQAFLLLYEWLRLSHEIDMMREITPFIDPFPEKYILKVLDPSYRPDASGFIDDYLDANPTRNRPLDMLPLFAWMDEERVRNRLKDELIRPRPAFHYRLPNSSIDDPDWTFTKEWNVWVQVERLAESGQKLIDMQELYLEKKLHPLKTWADEWMREMRVRFFE